MSTETLADACHNQANRMQPKDDSARRTRLLLRQAAAALEAQVQVLRDLRESCIDAYRAGRIPAEPFVRAGNVLHDYAEAVREHLEASGGGA